MKKLWLCEINERAKLMNKLVSIHIPKTGGSSFHKILQQQYAENQLFSFEKRIGSDQSNMKTHQDLIAKIPEQVMCIHGHFHHSELKPYLQQFPDTKLVTWLRNPIERVISHYYFLMQRISKNTNDKERYLENVSLLEFAECDSRKNLIHRYLQGSDLNSFFFIGILENFAKDISSLSHRLGWVLSNADFHEKNNIQNKYEVDEKTRRHIKELNKKDFKIYNTLLNLRNNNHVISAIISKFTSTKIY